LIREAAPEDPMKVTINVDCTPEEARSFLGLPDVKPMQEQLMQEVQERMTASIRSMGPAEMMKYWLPTAEGLDQWQALFSQMTGAKRD
jgi:hypothetical protein